MQRVLHGTEQLQRLFAALTEQVFQAELGVADPPLLDYLSKLLLRFVRMDAVFRLRDTNGCRLEDVAEMMAEADERRAKSKRDIYRHIGDFTLFWSGVYPEALRRMQATDQKDHLIDYLEQGKRSYYIASTFEDEPFKEEAPVLRRLSREFELCSFGLSRVRKEWETLSTADPEKPWDVERN